MFSKLADLTSSDPNYYTTSNQLDPGAASVVLGVVIMIGVIVLVTSILAIIGMWKTFTKAHQPGWAAIIPFYNLYVLVELSGSPMWYFWVILAGSLTAWIPLLGLLISAALIVIQILLGINVAKSFGKDAGYGVLLALLPFVGYLIFGFNKNIRYVGPMGTAATAGPQGTPPPPPVPPAQPPTPPPAAPPSEPPVTPNA